MNWIERLALGLMVTLFVGFATVLLLAPAAVVDLASQVETVHILARLLLVVVMYATVMGVIYLRVRRSSVPSIKGLRMRSSGSVSTLSIESTEEQVLEAVRRVAGVKAANTRIKSVRGRAEVVLDVVVAHDVEKLPNKQREIARTVDKVIKRQLGVRYASRPVVQLRIHGDDVSVVSASADVQSNVKPKETPTVPLPSSEKVGEDVQPRAGRNRGGLFAGKRDSRRSTEDDSPTVIGNEDSAAEDEFYAFLASTATDDDDDAPTRNGPDAGSASTGEGKFSR